MTSQEKAEQIRIELQIGVEQAFVEGYVISVALVPLEPLAMGNYKPVVSVRERLVRG